MTHEAFPSSGEEPVDFDQAFRELVEIDLGHNMLLSQLHTVHEAALDSDHATAAIREDRGEMVVDAMAQKRYIAHLTDEIAMPPGVFDQMVWIPRENSATAEKVERILVRHPRLSGEEYDLPDDVTVIPNDTFVVIVMKTGEEYRYLLNARGVIGYTDSEAVDKIEQTEKDDDDQDEKPDFFTITGDYWHVPLLTASELERMTIRQSQLQQQDVA